MHLFFSLILTLIFLFIIIPFSLMLKVLQIDLLNLKLKKIKSYWEKK